MLQSSYAKEKVKHVYFIVPSQDHQSSLKWNEVSILVLTKILDTSSQVS